MSGKVCRYGIDSRCVGYCRKEMFIKDSHKQTGIERKLAQSFHCYIPHRRMPWIEHDIARLGQHH